MPIGLAFVCGCARAYTRLPVQGHYFWDLFPALLARRHQPRVRVRADVDRRARRASGESDAGVASGLFNTGQQIGGAIGVAVGDDDRDDVHEPLRLVARRCDGARAARR